MNEEVKALWLDALRSDKYRQGRDYLKAVTPDGPRYCCLGVLCDIAVEEGVISAPDQHQNHGVVVATYGDYPVGRSYMTLPPEVTAWAGLDCSNPYVKFPLDGEHITTTLADLNDETKLSFKQIANVIEEQL